MPVVWVVQEGYGSDDALKVTIPEGCDVCDLLQKSAGMFSFGDVGKLLPSQLQLFVFGKQVSTRKLIKEVRPADPDADLTFEVRPRKGEIENVKACKEAKVRREKERGKDKSPMPQARGILSATHRHAPPKKPKTTSQGRSVTRTFSTPRKNLPPDPPAPTRIFTSRHEPPKRTSSPPSSFFRSKSNSRTPLRSPFVTRKSSDVLKLPTPDSVFGHPRRFGDTLTRSSSRRRSETDTFAVPIGFTESLSNHSIHRRRRASYERNESSDVAPKHRLEDEIHRKRFEEEKKKKEAERKKRIEERRRRHREEEQAEELRRKHELELARKLENEEKTRRAEDRKNREQAARLKVEREREKKKLAKIAKDLRQLETTEGATRHKISELQMAPRIGFMQDHLSEWMVVTKGERAKKKKVLTRRTSSRVTISLPKEDGDSNVQPPLTQDDESEFEEEEEIEEVEEETPEEDVLENTLERSMKRARRAVEVEEQLSKQRDQRAAVSNDETKVRAEVISEEVNTRENIEQVSTAERKQREDDESTALVMKLMAQEEEQMQQMQKMTQQQEDAEMQEALALAKQFEEEEARHKEEDDKKRKKEEFKRIKAEEEIKYSKSSYKGNENMIVLMRHSIRHDLGGFDKVPLSVWPDKVCNFINHLVIIIKLLYFFFLVMVGLEHNNNISTLDHMTLQSLTLTFQCWLQ